MAIHRYPGDFRVGVLHHESLASHGQPARRLTPKQMVMLVLNGYQRFRIDDQEFTLAAGDGSATAPQAMIVRLERDAMLQPIECRGAPFSKVTVSTAPDWLAGIELPEEAESRMPDIPPPMTGHLAHRFFAPDVEMLHSASAMISRARCRSEDLEELSFMSSGIDFYRAALNACAVASKRSAGPSTSAKIQTILRYVASHIDDGGLTPERLAKNCGLSMRTLQRLCREGFRQSPSEMIRKQRLNWAYTALRERSVTVGQAAFSAGYSNPANFATAFKREFGLTPKSVSAETAEPFPGSSSACLRPRFRPS